MLGYLVDLRPMDLVTRAEQLLAAKVARIFGRRPRPSGSESDRLKALSRRRLGLVRFRGSPR